MRLVRFVCITPRSLCSSPSALFDELCLMKFDDEEKEGRAERLVATV